MSSIIAASLDEYLGFVSPLFDGAGGMHKVGRSYVNLAVSQRLDINIGKKRDNFLSNKSKTPKKSKLRNQKPRSTRPL